MNFRDCIEQTATVTTANSVITLDGGAAATERLTFSQAFQVPTTAQKAGTIRWPDVPVFIRRNDGSWGVHNATLQRDGSGVLTLQLISLILSSSYNNTTKQFNNYGQTNAETVSVKCVPSHASYGGIAVRGRGSFGTWDEGGGEGLGYAGVASLGYDKGDVALGIGARAGGSATGDGAIAIGTGALANLNTGDQGIAIGKQAVADAKGAVCLGGLTNLSNLMYATVLGGCGNSPNHPGEHTWGINNIVPSGRTETLYHQRALNGMQRITTNATATRLAVLDPDTGLLIAGSDELACYKGLTSFAGRLVAIDMSSFDIKSWDLAFEVKVNNSNVASQFGTTVKSVIQADAGAAAWDVAITLDTGNRKARVEVTGEAAKNIAWFWDYDAGYRMVFP